MGKDEAVSLVGCAEQDRSHAGRHSGDDRGDRRGQHFDRVIDGHAVGDGSPRCVDVESDGFARILGFQVEEFLDQVLGGLGVDFAPDEDASLGEKLFLDHGPDLTKARTTWAGLLVLV